MQERVLKDNQIVGYIGDMAIVEDEYGDLFFFECPENLLPVGSVTDAELTSISSLEKEIQEEIKEFLSPED